MPSTFTLHWSLLNNARTDTAKAPFTCVQCHLRRTILPLLPPPLPPPSAPPLVDALAWREINTNAISATPNRSTNAAGGGAVGVPPVVSSRSATGVLVSIALGAVFAGATLAWVSVARAGGDRAAGCAVSFAAAASLSRVRMVAGELVAGLTVPITLAVVLGDAVAL